MAVKLTAKEKREQNALEYQARQEEYKNMVHDIKTLFIYNIGFTSGQDYDFVLENQFPQVSAGRLIKTFADGYINPYQICYVSFSGLEYLHTYGDGTTEILKHKKAIGSKKEGQLC